MKKIFVGIIITMLLVTTGCGKNTESSAGTWGGLDGDRILPAELLDVGGEETTIVYQSRTYCGDIAGGYVLRRL